MRLLCFPRVYLDGMALCFSSFSAGNISLGRSQR